MLLLISVALTAVLRVAHASCETTVPNTPVKETWCSTVLDSNNTSGVVVAKYGVPATTTLVTAATNGSIWYDSALMFLGGGIYDVFAYMAGLNQRNESIIKTARTVPFIIRPVNDLASPAGWWLTSMLVSPTAFPTIDTIPLPHPQNENPPGKFPRFPNLRLEPLGEHIFATLEFEYVNRPGDPFPLPPYFTYFLACDQRLAAGLPHGWSVKQASVWTPTWLFFNGQSWNGTWTCKCLAEVEKKGAAVTTPNQDRIVGESAAAGESAASTLEPGPGRVQAQQNGTEKQKPAVEVNHWHRHHQSGHGHHNHHSLGAPPVCAAMLEFETVYWGEWAVPHKPNTKLPNINGGSNGLAAKDDAAKVVYMATSTDYPSFGIGLVAVDLATGDSRVLGNNWPSAPTGFEGVNGLFFSVDFADQLGLVIGITEISKYGPVPPVPDSPGLPAGWTVIATVDGKTGVSTALTADLTPVLAAYPPVAGGVSALDGAGATLWLLGAEGADSPNRGPTWGPSPTGAPPVLIGVPLSKANPVADALTVIDGPTDGMVVCGLSYASSIKAVVAIEYNSTGMLKSGTWFNMPNARIRAYPVDKSPPITIGTVGAGKLNPQVGSSTVSVDGKYVYFGAVQGSKAFESAALITVDVVGKSLDVTLAAPSDDYDVLNTVMRC